MTATRVCKKCGSDDFKPHGKGSRCRPCHNRYNRKYACKNPETIKAKNEKYRLSGRRRELSIKALYNLESKDYQILLAKQDNKCAICNLEETTIDKRTNKPRSLAVDHCHTTDKVRGLLCQKCNQGIGMFKDNIRLLQEAIIYLEENHGS
jgi:hypothetical protein